MGNRAPLGEDKPSGSGRVHPHAVGAGKTVRLKGDEHPIHRVSHLWEKLIDDKNLLLAIEEVNKSHRWNRNHRPNKLTLWIDSDPKACVSVLKDILEKSFQPQKPRCSIRYDASAQKWRTINEPVQWPDQYIHHALIQVLQSVMMRGMDPYCCGSIRNRGTSHARKSIQHWMKQDHHGTKYCMQLDIRHFYDCLSSEVVLDRMRELVKDYRVLELIEQITESGVLIGYYTSQWFANTVLQPLDHMIRQSGAASHYVRYMDNFTIFGSNKRKLHQLRRKIAYWLKCHGLELKSDWQIFPVNKRMPCAVGYRYGRNHTIPRKRIFFRMKRQLHRYRRKIREGKPIPFRMAAGMLSRFGLLKHCSHVRLYRMLFQGERVQKRLKQITRAHSKKVRYLSWNMYLEQTIVKRRCEPKIFPTAS